ncbi:hypothetical protein ACFOET_00325 [Parapedobacter deserti]|uniref:Uncharacterized protein n=1 Tax=Parapedobacter deserti TaxID=1912957 RepID=A0ABV7JDI0_9SPHI
MIVREVVTPTKRQLTVTVPDAMIGKPLEVTIREKSAKDSRSKKKTIAELKAELEGLTVNMEGYRFDRDEANDYD